jgi:hypothetical protein
MTSSRPPKKPARARGAEPQAGHGSPGLPELGALIRVLARHRGVVVPGAGMRVAARPIATDTTSARRKVRR